MTDTLGPRQQALLTLLLEHKDGLTVDAMAAAEGITRSAVRQHLTGLERDGLIQTAGVRPTGGRPEQVYVLSPKGEEIQPRHYAWLAQLLIESLCAQEGHAALAERLATAGRQTAESLLLRQPPGPGSRVANLADLMADLGYRARLASPAADGTPTIEAFNCVFHQLAAKYPEVCQFDLALMATFTGQPVEHHECMVRGGRACRFRFKA